MKMIRRGIGVLALACAISTAAACSGNNRSYPDWGPRVSRGTSGGPGAKRTTRVKRNEGEGRNGNNGQRRGQRKNGNNGNGSNGKKRGNG